MTVFQYISTPSKGWCKLFTRWHRIKKGWRREICLQHLLGLLFGPLDWLESRRLYYYHLKVVPSCWSDFWILFRAHNQLAITLLLYIYVYIYIFEYCFQFSMKSPTSNKIDVGGVQLKYPQVSANLETKLICHSTCVTTQNPRPLFCLHASNSKALWTVSRVD